MNSNSEVQSLVIYRAIEYKLVKWHPDRIGQHLDRFYSYIGDCVGNLAGQMAHKMEYGPQAITNRIQNQLSGWRRDKLLDKWYQLRDGTKIFPGLERDCIALLKYARPKEAIVTQVTAFKAITEFITYYPPIRTLFLRYERFKADSDLRELALQLWKREKEPSEPEWRGFYELAATCLSRNIAEILEGSPMAEWGVPVSDGKLTVTERLLTKISSEKLEAFDRVAIRYLAGILEFPTFWVSDNYERHQYTAKTLLQKLSRCAQEVGIGSGNARIIEEEEFFSDRDGIDLLSDATLLGIQIWVDDLDQTGIETQCWFNDLQPLLKLLLRPETQVILPKSWITVTRYFQKHCKEHARWELCNCDDHETVSEDHAFLILKNSLIGGISHEAEQRNDEHEEEGEVDHSHEATTHDITLGPVPPSTSYTDHLNDQDAANHITDGSPSAHSGIPPKVALNNTLQGHPWLFHYKTALRYTGELFSAHPQRWRVQCYIDGTNFRVTSDPCSSIVGAEDNAARKMITLIGSNPRNPAETNRIRLKERLDDKGHKTTWSYRYSTVDGIEYYLAFFALVSNPTVWYGGDVWQKSRRGAEERTATIWYPLLRDWANAVEHQGYYSYYVQAIEFEPTYPQ